MPASDLFEKRVLLTPRDLREVDRLVDGICRVTGESVTFSVVVRAVLRTLQLASGEILRDIEGVGLVRPVNGDAHATSRYENEIARVFQRAIKKSRSFRSRA